MLSVLKEITDIWVTLGVGALIGIGFLVAAVYIPPVRQLCIGLAIAAFVATLAFGTGVRQERQVCIAKQAAAEQAARQRDQDQARIAGEDAEKLQADIEAARRREQEAQERYEQTIRKSPACALTIDDLR